ncbi:hypothetical protein LSCM4_02414 [Leishmania orientalis]|uniref:diacylglycerol O-acyltransferase n=1 Tax=Leishmania orientalis TaxID=2249476 RepID=A0A836G9E4_9TRYP|nr:hypothetical protein LSCM4_02414 [Leishmania orientalis]
MSVVLSLFVFTAVVVIPLLSFLRNGAILRGGAVHGMQKLGKGSESSSIIALCGDKTPRLPAKRSGAASTLQEAAPNATTSGNETLALGSPASLCRRSREMLPRARGEADVQKRRQQSQQASGQLGAAVEAKSVSLTSFDAASVWDRKQLSADDGIRLVFLGTLVVPIFACWYCFLRAMERKALLRIHRHCTSANETTAIDECPQTFFRFSIAVLLLGFGSVALVWYASVVYLNHREKDVTLKRHNKTWCDRAVNWFKFRVYRRYVDCQCRLWKRYFSLQLVPAYGPLPLFRFPNEAEHGERDNSAMDSGYPPMRALGLTSEAQLDTQFATAPTLQRPTSPIGLRRQAQGSSLDAVPNEASAPNPHTRNYDIDKHIWDEVARQLLRPRYSSALRKSTRLSSKRCFDAHVRQPSVALFSEQYCDCSPPPPPLQPPGMRRAQYFFAAHPHGILPWCCCVNMISNVAHCDEKLFLDNRELVLHSCDAPQMPVFSERMQQLSPMSSLPRAAAILTTSITRALSPSSSLIKILPASLPTATVGGSAGVHSAAGGASYAKGRYYVYDLVFKKFVLRLGKDDAVPATSADAAVYRQRLRHAQAKHDAAALSNGASPGRPLPRSSVDAGPASAEATASSLRRRLRIRIRAVVASFSFYVPIMREIYMLYGYMDASYDTCKRILLYNNSTEREREGSLSVSSEAPTKDELATDAKGGSKVDDDGSDDEYDEGTLPNDLNHLLLFPGGASESLLSSAHGPARLLLRCRKGFLRLAIHTQSGLVPVYTFGETDYFEQCSSATAWHATPVHDDEDSTYTPREASGAGVLLNPEARAVGGAPLQTVANASPLAQERQQTPCRPPQSGPAAGLNDCATASLAPTDHRGDLSSFTSATPPISMPQPCQPPDCGPRFTLPMVSPIAPALSHPPATLCEVQRQESWKDQERRPMKEAGESRERNKRVLTPLYLHPMLSAELHESGDSAAPRKEVKAATLASHEGGLVEESQGDVDSISKRLAHRQAAEEKASASSLLAVGRFWRFIRVLQRLFQKTFGVSLPIVKNIIPHRVTGATVVGRPIYFELPPDLQRMYTDPANYFDTEKDKEVLQAAQEVYFHELQELFLKYAPQYLKDPSRRKLEII